MSFFDKKFMTKAEVEETPFCKLPSQFQIGDHVGIIMDNNLDGSQPESEIVPGVVVSVTFDVGEVRYGVAFPIADSNMYVVSQYLRTNMASISKGSTNFVSKTELKDSLKDILGDAPHIEE